MPRIARLDTPGLLNHVMIRGIERRKIFNDDKDRENFVESLVPIRLAQVGALAYDAAHVRLPSDDVELPAELSQKGPAVEIEKTEPGI